MRELMYISNKKGEKEAVILPFEEYKEYMRLKKEVSSLEETLYLMKSQKNRDRLLKSISDVEKGNS
jgi:PHD/YefM family antitoxin component YafN of YafNO toxin-antitoxin module